MTDETTRPADDQVRRPTLEDIDPVECMRLLKERPVGRLGFISEDNKPVILPVNHVVDQGDVAFRTTRGTKLDVAQRLAGSPVVYEVDSYDAAEETGWSVIVAGTLEPVLDSIRSAHLDRIGRHIWSNDIERTHWVIVRPEQVTGRRIVKPDD